MLGIAAWVCVNVSRSPPLAYWVWAGIAAESAPATGDLYIYQGQYLTLSEGTRFTRHGLYPYPLPGRSLYLVYRIDGTLPDYRLVLGQFEEDAEKWRQHGTPIIGLQIDFDAATAHLLAYGDYLEELRRHLPVSFRLSITGLEDWVLSGEVKTLERLDCAPDEMVVQFYQGRRMFADTGRAIRRLRHFDRPFRIGLLADAPALFYALELLPNPMFRGVVIFLQKPQ